MKVDVTVLIENSTPIPGVVGEYGLGMLVRVDGRGILFDTGMADGLVRNLKTMQIPPQAVELIAISHGHFDHVGGLPPVLEYLGPRDVYIHSKAPLPKYSLAGDQRIFIGMPRPEELEKKGANLVYNDSPVELMPGVILSGSIPRTNDFEDTGGNFGVEVDGKMETDNFDDDQALFIKHPDGLIIISGCAHAGMINTIEYARTLTGVDRIKAWIGGTHLINANEARMRKTIDQLRSYDMETIAVSHCTGFFAAAQIYGELGTRVSKGGSGMGYTF
ncbi:MAG: MBL fold metallo-hydrolase [Syntrophomonadales bacterium]